MKKISLIFAGLVLLAMVYNLVSAKEGTSDSQQATSEYIVIRYNPVGYTKNSAVIVHYGGEKIEKLEVPSELSKHGGTTNYVIDLLNQFNTKGYTLVSTTADVSEITCFLKQSR